ncbi:ribonuclease-like 3 [Neoarius graeffei]|uniref:ribonuclease-like 3 n=1 Tax=Neoarius graeffei TaxID=443677 RepID=UPI00298C54FD|nr:ribonuclease-like 3 [Neoarius graeffei]XP_060769202.1 ribonuclease-like 3 [Neoarius graeffei]
MQICVFGLVLLVFCISLPAEAQTPDVTPRYKKFLNQHVYQKMAETRCNSVIFQREITDGNTNNCKPVNTFIKASPNLVKAVCQGITGPVTSSKPFPVVTCKLHSGKRRPDCKYKKGVSLWRSAYLAWFCWCCASHCLMKPRTVRDLSLSIFVIPTTGTPVTKGWRVRK